MANIFSRAKAAGKVIGLFDSMCGVPRSKLRCDARLESDLGVFGDDTYELLEAMHQAGVDMTEFDCHDRITPEGMPALPMVVWLALSAGCAGLLLPVFSFLPDWLVCTIAFVSAGKILCLVSRLLPEWRHDELRVGDLVASVEAGRWISPKAEHSRLDSRC